MMHDSSAARSFVDDSPFEPTSVHAPRRATPEYSVLIMARNEGDNLRTLLPQLRSVLDGQGGSYEIIVIDGNSRDDTVQVCIEHGAQVFPQRGDGYGAAFREGLARCAGTWIITLDADYSHPPQVIRSLLKNRHGVDMLIGSRYTLGGDAKMEMYRNLLSQVLSLIFGRGLGIPVRDVSSGFRMYRREVVQNLGLVGRDFDVLIETLARIVSEGFTVREVPFIYEPRIFGRSNARVFKFAISYLRTLKRMWNLRNTATSADYEERAYSSLIPLQRFWQRRRTRHTLDLAERMAVTLDVGSGSSRVTRSLPNVVAVDCNRRPLRFLLSRGVSVVEGTLHTLPFQDGAFEQVIMGEVIQQIPKARFSLSEVKRVLQPGGVLILSTPDYSHRGWRLLEKIYLRMLPDSPSSLHCSPYTRQEIRELLEREGFELLAERSVWNMDVVFKARLRQR